MPEVFTVYSQVRAPKGNDHGQVIEGAYIVENGVVILTNRSGNPIRDAEGKTYRQKLMPGEYHKPVAAVLTRKFAKARRGANAPKGFSGRINYPKSWNSVA